MVAHISNEGQNTPRRKWWHDVPDAPRPKKEKPELDRVKQPPNQLTLEKLAQARMDCIELAFIEGIEAFRRRDKVALLNAYDEYRESCWRYTNGDPVRFEELDKHLREFHRELVIDNDSINGEPCSKLPCAVSRFVRLTTPKHVRYFDFVAPAPVRSFPQIDMSARISAYIAVAVNRDFIQVEQAINHISEEVDRIYRVAPNERGKVQEQVTRQLVEALAQTLNCTAILEPLNSLPPESRVVVKQPAPLPAPVNGGQAA